MDIVTDRERATDQVAPSASDPSAAALEPLTPDPLTPDPLTPDPLTGGPLAAGAPGLEAGESAGPGAAGGRITRPPALDAACAAAVDLARAAAVEEAGTESAVGEHLGVEAEDERVVLHRFACLLPGYPGWAWTVVVTRASRMRYVTVDDVVLLPGAGATLAPAWVPWSERLLPGDLGVGDLLPTAADDPRLTLRVFETEEFEDPDAWQELGLGRPRVLSPLGREETAERWFAGEPGPAASIARAAPAHCDTCGFHVRLAGSLGLLFGVCANEFAPDDSRVTALEHGCGAHSEALVAPSDSPESLPGPDAGPPGLDA